MDSTPVRHRLLPVLGLLVLSPICAEYLIGYDESIGHPLQLLFGLLLFVPLYGTAAVLVREVTRRAGRGWPTMLLLAGALGLVQAGIADQSLFHLEFDPDDPTWATQQPPTTIPLLGIDARNLLGFVGGHVIWSFCAPAAVVEACAPRSADRPWLGRVGLSVVALVYLVTVGFFFRMVGAGGASTVELAGTAVAVVALVVLAFAVPRRTDVRPGRVPPAWAVGCGAVAVFAVEQQLPTSWGWVGVAADVVLLAGAAVVLYRWSRRASWSRMHVLAVAGATLVVRVATSFFVEPLGHPPYPVKYAVNTVLTLGILGLLVWARHRQATKVSTG